MTFNVSLRFVDQEAATDLLDEMPALVGDIVKIDPVIDRAERYGLESLHRKLIEVCLRHNLSPYHKSRAFEGLIKHQTRLVYHCSKLNIRNLILKGTSTQNIKILVRYRVFNDFYWIFTIHFDSK